MCWRQRLVVWVDRLSLARLGPGGPFGVDVVAGGIRFLVRGGWLVQGRLPLVVGGVRGWSAGWLPSHSLVLFVPGGLWPGWVGWWAVVVVGVVLVVVAVGPLVVVALVVVGLVLRVWPLDRLWVFRLPCGGRGSGILRSSWGCTMWWAGGAGRGPGLTVTVVEGSHVPGSVWLAVVVVCGGWMTGRLATGMLTRVWTGSFGVAASAVVVAAGWRGAWVVVGWGSWLGLRFGLGQCWLGLCRCVCGVVCARLGAGLGLGSGLAFGSGSRLRRTSVQRCEGANVGSGVFPVRCWGA